ncbi:D-ribose transporter subunit RbsB [Gammaproteobacteria bacterium]|nr:D-ribose transporter subunit RbsB [Gammaproteobacteria bacterium]
MFRTLLKIVLAAVIAFSSLTYANEKPKIAFLMKTLSNEYFIKMQEGAQKAAATMGVDLIIQVAEKEDSTEQLVALVENMIASKVAAIVVTPNDSTAFVPVFLRAEQAGIPIIDLDVELDKKAAATAGLTYYYVGVDNFDGGYKAAKYLVDTLKGVGKVAILEGIPGVDNGEQRKAGALKAFKEASGIEVVTIQTANWETEQALNVTTNILTAHPDITGIFAANDNMAFGAVTAIENAGLIGKVHITGYDGLPLAYQYVKEGKMLCTIDQLPSEQAAKAIEFALKRIKKEEIPTHHMNELVIVTKENAI